MSASCSSRLAPGIAAVAADGPVGGDHPVAGDEQADRVTADRAPDGPSGPRRADTSGDLAVADRRPPRHAGDGAEDSLSQTGRSPRSNGGAGTGRPARQERSRAAIAAARWARRGSSSSRVRRLDRRDSSASERRIERRLGRSPGDGHDAEIAGGDEEWPPRPRDRGPDGWTIGHRGECRTATRDAPRPLHSGDA